MKKTYTITGMTCNGCRGQVEKILHGLDNVTSATVNLELSEAVIKAPTPLNIQTLQSALPEKYTIQEKLQNVFEQVETIEKSELQQLTPLFLIFFYITTAAVLMNFNNWTQSEDFTPILVKDVAKVYLGPAERRGILDKEGAEVVGGVVVARFGANPMEVINNVKGKIETIASGLPTKTLKDGRISQLTVVPFYDRTELIEETLHTLEEALSLEILITLLIIIIMVLNLRASVLIASILPIAVLLVFVTMKLGNVDANIVALSGIAIAIGTMVDMGIVLIGFMNPDYQSFYIFNFILNLNHY